MSENQEYTLTIDANTILVGDFNANNFGGTVPTNPFSDDKDSDYYNAVIWAVKNSVTTGKNKTSFEPDDP